MKLSRDEAREVAAIAIGLTIALRVGAGVFQMLEELSGEWSSRSLLSRFLAPVGSTMGILALALALLLVLSPTGSIEQRAFSWARPVAGVVAVLGAVSALNGITSGFGSVMSRIWFAAINGFAALVLGAAAWWILSNFDPDR